MHKGGAQFHFEKATWFNHEWIKKTDNAFLSGKLQEMLDAKNISASPEKVETVVALIKERCTLLPDLWLNSYFFFEKPAEIEIEAIKPKWTDIKTNFFKEVVSFFNVEENWNAQLLEQKFKDRAAEQHIKAGDVLLPLRIMLVGRKVGPGVFDIAGILGKEETIQRINHVISLL